MNNRPARRGLIAVATSSLSLLLVACSNVTPRSAVTLSPTTPSPSSGTSSTLATVIPTTTSTVIDAGLTGMGATLSMFKTKHRADNGLPRVCSATDSCFGSELTNAEYGSTYQFINALIVDGRITGYQENFSPGTDLSTVEADVLQLMPADAVMGALTTVDNSGSCAMFNVTSSTLGSVFSGLAYGDPQGIVGVEVTSIDSNGNLIYDPHNVQEANLSTQPVDPASTC